MSLKATAKRLFAINKREWRRIVTRPIYAFSIFFAPIITALVMLSLMRCGLPTNLPAGIVDMDNTATSRTLVRQLNCFQQTGIVMQTKNIAEARQALQEGKIFGYFYIPEGFTADATAGRQPKISFYTTSSFMIGGSLLFKDMETISVLAGKAVSLQLGLAYGQTEDAIIARIQPIAVHTHALGNPWLNYSVYLNNCFLPGMMQLLIFMITVYSIGIEIKEGTSRQWLSRGGNSLTVCLLGKLLPQTLLWCITGLLILSLLYGYGHFPLLSGWGPMLGTMFCLIIASQAVGVFMISILPTLRMGLSFASLFGMLSFSVCGFSFPVQAMYSPIHALAYLFPMRHYFEIYVSQALNGQPLFYCWWNYVALLCFLLLPILNARNLKRELLHFKYIP